MQIRKIQIPEFDLNVIKINEFEIRYNNKIDKNFKSCRDIIKI